MKKVFTLIAVLAIAISFTTMAKAADDMDFHMNMRFWNTDNGNQAENRWSLHTVEFSAAKEVENFGGFVKYRLSDQLGNDASSSNQSYLVGANVYYKSGMHKVTLGLQFVPFGIYEWNNLYHPCLDIPGAMGKIWDADWGVLYTFDDQRFKLDIGYWDNSGEAGLPGGVNINGTNMEREPDEKNTITLRAGYDILPIWNLGVSYLDGSADLDDVAGNLADTESTMWAIDTTVTPYKNLFFEAEYVDYDYDDGEGMENDGDFGLVQVRYDILKVPAPLDMIQLVGQYSWLDPSFGGVGQGKIKNYQEQIRFKIAKNLNIFWQNVQEKYPSAWGQDTDKYHYFAVKYDLF
ncbi:MAG TPA: hypothetical protein PLN69_00100 [bacterium]|nr:hypothetical protein [bacterium]